MFGVASKQRRVLGRMTDLSASTNNEELLMFKFHSPKGSSSNHVLLFVTLSLTEGRGCLTASQRVGVHISNPKNQYRAKSEPSSAWPM